MSEPDKSAEFSKAAKLLVAMGLVVAGLWWYNERTVVGIVDYRMSAPELLLEFGGNQAAAHARYVGKNVEVTDIVRSVRMQGSTPVLYVGPPLANVQCHLPKSAASRAGTLKFGDDIKVVGRIDANGSIPYLKPCEIR